MAVARHLQRMKEGTLAPYRSGRGRGFRMVPRTRGNYDPGVIEAPQIVASGNGQHAEDTLPNVHASGPVREVGDGTLLRRLLWVGRSQEERVGVPAQTGSERAAQGGGAYVCDDDGRTVGTVRLAHERWLHACRHGEHRDLLAARVSDPRGTDDAPARQCRSCQ